MAAGHVMLGLPVSCTVTVKVQFASFPASSVAVTATYTQHHEGTSANRLNAKLTFDVVPTSKLLPEALLYTIVTSLSALSVALAGDHVAVVLLSLVLTTTLEGHKTVDASLSVTVTVKEQVAALLLPSVDV
jgi:hypothetical protein